MIFSGFINCITEIMEFDDLKDLHADFKMDEMFENIDGLLTNYVYLARIPSMVQIISTVKDQIGKCF